MDTENKLPNPNPWIPMKEPIDVKHLGKLVEEVNELGAAIARCLIQGIEECEPVTKKPNREWLENEIADVRANIALVIKHFKLDEDRMSSRIQKKCAHLKQWHGMLA